MQIYEERHGDVQVVTIDDHLDTSTAPMFEARLLALIEGGQRRVLIDCGPLQYINSAGLKVFLLAMRKIAALGGQLVLCALAPNVRVIFETIGFSQIMTIMGTREEALRSLQMAAVS